MGWKIANVLVVVVTISDESGDNPHINFVKRKQTTYPSGVYDSINDGNKVYGKTDDFRVLGRETP